MARYWTIESDLDITAGESVRYNSWWTSWSSGWSLSTARQTLAWCWTQSAWLFFGWDTWSVSAITEEYNQSVSISVRTFTL